MNVANDEYYLNELLLIGYFQEIQTQKWFIRKINLYSSMINQYTEYNFWKESLKKTYNYLTYKV